MCKNKKSLQLMETRMKEKRERSGKGMDKKERASDKMKRVLWVKVGE